MESVFEVDRTNRVGRWSLRGRITDQFFGESLRNVGAVLVGMDLVGGIIDLTRVTSFEIKPETLQQLASADPVLSRSMLRLIVTSDKHALALARMFADLSQETRPNLFVVRSMDVAFRVLGIHSPNFKPYPT